MTPASILIERGGAGVLTWGGTGYEVRNWRRVNPGIYAAETRGNDLSWLGLRIDSRDPAAGTMTVDVIVHPISGWQFDQAQRVAWFLVADPLATDSWADDYAAEQQRRTAG